MFAHFVILLQVIFIFHNVLSDNSAQVSKDVNQFNASGLINSGVNMAKNSPLVPVPAKGIIAAGSALADGYNEYNESGDWKLARAKTLDSAIDGGLDVVKSVPGSSVVTAGVRAADGYRRGDNLNKILTDAGTEAISGAPGGKAALTGLKAAKSFHDGKSLQEIAAESGGEALRNYAGNNPALKNLEVPGGKAALTGLKTAKSLHDGKSLQEIAAESGGEALRNYAGNNPTLKNLEKVSNLQGNMQKQLPNQVSSSSNNNVKPRAWRRISRRIKSTFKKPNSKVPSSARRTNNSTWKRIQSGVHRRVSSVVKRATKRIPSSNHKAPIQPSRVPNTTRK